MIADLAPQTVLITGAANGLGRALAEAFSEAGARLALVDYDEQRLGEVASSLPWARAYVADLSDGESTRRMIAAVRTDYPAVDTLVHNAGFLKPQAFNEMDDARWNLTFNVGIQAAYLLTKAFWSGWLRTGGAAIYVSSRSGIEGFAGEAAYCATKHAIEGFVKALALEGADDGVFVHAVTPGILIRTPMSEQNYTPELKAQWVDPKVIAPAFVYLASRPDKALSGQRLNAWELSRELAARR